jgi:hypothetical protein
VSTEKDTKKIENAPLEDWFLQNLVDFANKYNMAIGITLNVGGFLISGLLISGKEYFQGFASDFASGVKEKELAETVKELFSKYGDIYKEQEGIEIPLPIYIHLKEARFFNTAGGPIPGNRAVWWRGRISQVQGFILGNLSKQ